MNLKLIPDSKVKATLILLFISSLLCFVSGIWTGYELGKKEIRANAIETEHGEYDSKTGEFRFK